MRATALPGDRISLYRRSLAKDGLRRAEIRSIQDDPWGLTGYAVMAWAEWETLGLIADAAAELGDSA